jgi:hypothetical protein
LLKIFSEHKYSIAAFVGGHFKIGGRIKPAAAEFAFKVPVTKKRGR